MGISDEELERATSICAKATPGPWTWMVKPPFHGEDVGRITSPLQDVCDFGNDAQYYPTEGTAPSAEDLEFILEARTLLPLALKTIAELKKGNGWPVNVIHLAGPVYQGPSILQQFMDHGDAKLHFRRDV